MNPTPEPAQTPQRIGRGMLIVAWTAALGLLSLLFSGLLQQQRNPNIGLQASLTSDGMMEVRLERSRNGHYFAPGMIEGVAVEFMLDTGASDVVLPEAVAREAGLSRGTPTYYETANGTVTAYRTRLNRLELAGMVLNGVRASINPQMGGETVLLGMSALKQLEFTQRGDTLIIRQHQ